MGRKDSFFTMSVFYFCMLVANLVPVLCGKVEWLRSIACDIFYNLGRVRSISGSSISGSSISPSVGPSTTTNYLITGALGGIGSELVTKLINETISTSLISNLVLQTRDAPLLDNFLRNRFPNSRAKTSILGVDFTNVSSLVDSFVGVEDLDVVIHNAGLMSTKASVADIHKVNCIAPLVTTLLLLPDLIKKKKENKGKTVVLFLTSSSHIRSPLYTRGDISGYVADDSKGAVSLRAYSVAKMNLLLASLYLKDTLADTGLQFVSVHPGLVDTRMVSDFYFFGSTAFPLRSRLFLSPREAAASVLTALKTVRSSGEGDDVLFPAYFVNGALANHRASRLLQVVKDENGLSSPSSSPLRFSSRVCFEDLVSSLPSSLRRTISDRLLVAASQLEVGEEEVQKCGGLDCGNAERRQKKTIHAFRQLAVKCTESGGLE